jgi:hypothetical protein
MSSASLNSESNSNNSDDVAASADEYSPLDNDAQDQSIAKGGVTTP